MSFVEQVREQVRGRATGAKVDQEASGAGSTTMRATWKGSTLAESDRTVIVEGNHYFPPDAVRWEHLKPSTSHTTCPWNCRASYHSVEVDGAVNADAAWFYPDPKPAAAEIKDHVAFWHGVSVKPAPPDAG